MAPKGKKTKAAPETNGVKEVLPVVSEVEEPMNDVETKDDVEEPPKKEAEKKGKRGAKKEAPTKVDDGDKEDEPAKNNVSDKKKPKRGAKKTEDLGENDEEASKAVTKRTLRPRAEKVTMVVEEKKTVKKSAAKKAKKTEASHYEVLDIIEMREKKSKKKEFLIRWKGYSSDDDAWVSEKDLNCPKLLERFFKKQEAATT